MYITYNKDTKKVAYLGKKKPISYSDILELAEVDSVPQKYDYLIVDNVQEKSRVIKEAYTEEVSSFNEEKGEDEIKIIEHPQVTELYLICDLIPKFYEYTEEQIEAQKKKKYKDLVEQYIGQRYSVGDELSIQRQEKTKPEEYEEYFSYCEECKVKAKTIVYGK